MMFFLLLLFLTAKIYKFSELCVLLSEYSSFDVEIFRRLLNIEQNKTDMG